MKLILFTARGSIIELRTHSYLLCLRFQEKTCLLKFCILVKLHNTLGKLKNYTGVSCRFNSNRTYENPYLHNLNKRRAITLCRWNILSSFHGEDLHTPLCIRFNSVLMLWTLAVKLCLTIYASPRV
jgi:hypothetical protein